MSSKVVEALAELLGHVCGRALVSPEDEELCRKTIEKLGGKRITQIVYEVPEEVAQTLSNVLPICKTYKHGKQAKPLLTLGIPPKLDELQVVKDFIVVTWQPGALKHSAECSMPGGRTVYLIPYSKFNAFMLGMEYFCKKILRKGVCNVSSLISKIRNPPDINNIVIIPVTSTLSALILSHSLAKILSRLGLKIFMPENVEVDVEPSVEHMSGRLDVFDIKAVGHNNNVIITVLAFTDEEMKRLLRCQR